MGEWSWPVPGVWWVRWLSGLTRIGAASALVATLAVVGAGGWIRHGSAGSIFTEETVPAAPVALVLGAEVYPDGVPSPFLSARLGIAERLLRAGKVRAILVSGDHGRWSYDEPGAMRGWLVARGVPDDKVVSDFAGFDTYDSCARARRVFGVRSAIVVTQSYHVPRAVTLCRRLGVRAYGVGDDSVRRYADPWVHSSTREYGAWVKAAVDVASGRDPVFLGPHESGVDRALHAP